ncbi:MAG TPA: tetratricopeptide repeat protein [Candidatus Eisenbacteria bacterium]
MARLVLLALFVCAAAGCAGGRDARPALPEGTVAIPVLLAEADSTAAGGNPADARNVYARAARAAARAGSRPLEIRAQLGTGLTSLALADAESARRAFLRAVELDPALAAAHVGLGRYHAAIRHYKDAKEEFERAAALDTLSPEPLYRLGLAYAEAKQTKLAAEALTRALARDPTHAPSLEALGALSESRYLTVGLPAGYAALRAHSSVSRGELGVMLAAELGADPERPSWHGAKDYPSDTEEARGAWGERWIRVSLARGWLAPFPDGSYHLGDPVTRGALALLIAAIEKTWTQSAGGSRVPPSPGSADDPAARRIPAPDPFPDVGPRHYLFRPAQEAARIGLPLRPEGRFEPWASATGSEAFAALKGLARALGVEAVLPEEPGVRNMVK